MDLPHPHLARDPVDGVDPHAVLRLRERIERGGQEGGLSGPFNCLKPSEIGMTTCHALTWPLRDRLEQVRQVTGLFKGFDPSSVGQGPTRATL